MTQQRPDIHRLRNNMTEPSFLIFEPSKHHEVVLSLNREYMSWVCREIERQFGAPPKGAVGQTPLDHTASVIQLINTEHSQGGVFYLIMVSQGLAGMCGLRCIRSGVAEFKRIYIRPKYRGMRLGQLAVQRLISDARSLGYHRICLDTAAFMKAAHRIYEAHGFVDCEAYEGTEVATEYQAGWRFMHRSLLHISKDCVS